MERRALLAQRLATQRLTAAPTDPVRVVGEALAVQSQDAPMARWSIGMRSGTLGSRVAAAVDEGRIVRTHVLRPTWHYVLPADLRWLLALSAERIERSMGARHRQLRITGTVIERAFAVIRTAISAQGPLTRRQLHPLLPTTGFPEQGQVVGHLLMLAELRGLVVSGPSAGGQHTYVLFDDVVPPAPPRPREDVVRELAARFFAGHGPASVRELTRWAAVTQAETRRALDGLWQRRATGATTRVTLDLSPAVSGAQREAIVAEAQRLADFEGRPLDLAD